MSTSQTSTTQEQRHSTASLVIYWTAFIFILLAIGSIGLIVSNIASVLELRQPDENTGTTILRFLNEYGIFFPLILIALGGFFLSLAIRTLKGNGNAAAWAQQTLLWLGLLCGVVFLQAFGAGASGLDGTLGRGIENGAIWLIIGVILFGSYALMNASQRVFKIGETLEQASSRNAWNLLIPTVVLLVVVALRPLEATIVASLTDATFASQREPNWVGLDNYSQLLSFRVDLVPCARLEDGTCELNAAGNPTFPRPRAHFESIGDPSYRELRYGTINDQIIIGDTQVLLSGRDDAFISSIGNTMFFTFFSVIAELTLGLGIALIINSKFSGRGLLRTAMLVPWAIPTVVSARLWETMLRDNQSGVINHLLTNVVPVLNVSQAWLANPSLQIWALIAVDVWKTTPFMALIILAGLQVIPSDVYEAADVDGASKIRQFWNITLPLLRPTIAVALVFRTLDAVRAFDVFQVLLGNQKFSMATYNYNSLVIRQEFGYASAIGVVIFIIILLFTVAYVRILGVDTE